MDALCVTFWRIMNQSSLTLGPQEDTETLSYTKQNCEQ